jgi:hypothetical protein
MVSLQLSVADLLRCRFAISPVNEVGEAGRAIANPPALAAHRAWLREHDPALQRLATAHDFRPLFALLHPRVHTPELLRPPPRAAAGEIDVELEQIAATSKKRVRSEVERCLNSRGRVVQEVDRPLRSRDAAARLAEMLAALWDEFVAPSWPQIRDCLERDIAYRSRNLAGRGLAAVLEDLAAPVTLGRVQADSRTANEPSATARRRRPVAHAVGLRFRGVRVHRRCRGGPPAAPCELVIGSRTHSPPRH